MTACRFNHPDLIELLVKSGAELNTANHHGMTAMTILRLQMGFNDSYTSDSQRNLRKMYALLKSKGGKEKDYVQLIAENYQNGYPEEQTVVLQVKKDFAEFNGNSKSYTTKTYSTHTHEGEEMFTDNKNKYVAKYDKSGQLVYFQHKLQNPKVF